MRTSVSTGWLKRVKMTVVVYIFLYSSGRKHLKPAEPPKKKKEPTKKTPQVFTIVKLSYSAQEKKNGNTTY
jgi:hypothetical protein